ncbi:MAG: hypothetical protein F4108_03825 [Acidimicrobiaceae bacterium]|nr:hypothetical protein [Acidimicrobiaceae bacterium]
MSDERLHQDELVSAYLDGEATPAEIAEVAASDALLARVEELRAVRDAVAEVVAPLPADRQDDLISAALGVADAAAADRVEAKVVPLQRPQRLLLAMAAAVIVLAAVVGTGLIASRSGDDSEEFASVASTANDAAPTERAAEEPMAEEAPAAEEEPMAGMDMEAPDEAMVEMDMAAAAEEPLAEEAAMAAAELQAAEEAMAAAEQAAAEAMAAAEEAAAPSTTDARRDAEEPLLSDPAADEAEPGDDAQLAPVADLGALETLEELVESIGASWSAALEDGAVADPGACSSAVNERALELSAETLHSFVATVGVEDPVAVDGRFARRADGTSFIVYASPPDCEVQVHDLPGS